MVSLLAYLSFSLFGQQQSVLPRCISEFTVLVQGKKIFNLGFTSRQGLTIWKGIGKNPGRLSALASENGPPFGAISLSGVVLNGKRNKLALLDLGSGKSRIIPRDSNDTINWVAINSNAKWASAAGHSKLYIWDAHSREKLCEIEMDLRVIGNLAISPDGSEILIEANWRLSLYDVATQKEEGVIEYWEDWDLDAAWWKYSDDPRMKSRTELVVAGFAGFQPIDRGYLRPDARPFSSTATGPSVFAVHEVRCLRLGRLEKMGILA